jgi:tetratricopeptide (TPR) repeat protein
MGRKARRARERPAGDAGQARAAPGPPPPVVQVTQAALAFAAILRKRALLLVIAAAAAIKAAVLAQLHDHPLLQPAGGLDSETYVRLAERAAAGDWALGPEPFFVSPLYVYFLAVVLKATGSVLAAQTVQAMLGAAAVGLVGASARRLFGGPASRWAAVLAAATGVFTFNEVVLLQSALDPFLTALSLALLARALHTSRGVDFAATGFAVGLHALNRPNVLLWAAVLPLIVAATPRWRRGAIAVVLGSVLALAPVAARNRVVAGQWVLVSSHGGLNFFIGNNPEADGTYRAVAGIRPSIEGQATDARRVAGEALGRTVTDAEASRWFYRRGLQFIREHPAHAGQLLLRKVAYTLNAADLALNHSFEYYRSRESRRLRLLAVGPWLLVPLGLFGALTAPSALPARARWTWLAFLPVYAASVAVFFVSGRYRVPLLVPLCATAAAGLVHLAAVLRNRSPKAIALRAAALAVLALGANWDWHLDDGRDGEETEMILWLVDQRRVDDAQARLAQVEATHRYPALLHFRVGRALQDQGRLGDAVALFRKARAEDPVHMEVRLALGQALLDSGHPEEAIGELRAARGAGVRPDVAAFDLARALARLGRRDEARQALAAITLPADADAASALALGRLALELDDAALAEPPLTRAVRAAPISAEAREGHSVALFRLGRFEEAADELEAALRLDPGSATARLNLAVIRGRQGRYADARRLAAEALRLRPGYAQAQGLLAELDRLASRNEKARRP